jgi:hypothetical protein
MMVSYPKFRKDYQISVIQALGSLLVECKQNRRKIETCIKSAKACEIALEQLQSSIVNGEIRLTSIEWFPIHRTFIMAIEYGWADIEDDELELICKIIGEALVRITALMTDLKLDDINVMVGQIADCSRDALEGEFIAQITGVYNGFKNRKQFNWYSLYLVLKKLTEGAATDLRLLCAVLFLIQLEGYDGQVIGIRIIETIINLSEDNTILQAAIKGAKLVQNDHVFILQGLNYYLCQYGKTKNERGLRHHSMLTLPKLYTHSNREVHNWAKTKLNYILFKGSAEDVHYIEKAIGPEEMADFLLRIA